MASILPTANTQDPRTYRNPYETARTQTPYSHNPYPYSEHQTPAWVMQRSSDTHQGRGYQPQHSRIWSAETAAIPAARTTDFVAHGTGYIQNPYGQASLYRSRQQNPMQQRGYTHQDRSYQLQQFIQPRISNIQTGAIPAARSAYSSTSGQIFSDTEEKKVGFSQAENHRKVTQHPKIEPEDTLFKNLHLIPELLQAVADQGYREPTPVQQQAIPLILSGKDLIARFKTGSGKTASFALPILQNLMGNPKQSGSIRALILAPTRELAAQIQENVQIYGKYLPLKSAAIFGGVKPRSQIDKLRQGVDILIATPGRLLDFVSQKVISLSEIEFLVLDEADKMLDMGFIEDIEKVIALLPKARQNLLFSATFPKEIQELAQKFLNQPERIEAPYEDSTVEAISQVIHMVDNNRKKDLLAHLIKKDNWKQVLVFTRTKREANQLANYLKTEGIDAAAIHSGKGQKTRTKALTNFKKGNLQVLVATDLASRGLDIDQLPYVVNYELPNVPDSYIHRIGRTGRAGNKGIAISLVCIDEYEFLKNIERFLKRKIPQILIPGFEPDPTIKAQPINMGKFSSTHQKQNWGPRPQRNNYRNPPFYTNPNK